MTDRIALRIFAIGLICGVVCGTFGARIVTQLPRVWTGMSGTQRNSVATQLASDLAELHEAGGCPPPVTFDNLIRGARYIKSSGLVVAHDLSAGVAGGDNAVFTVRIVKQDDRWNAAVVNMIDGTVDLIRTGQPPSRVRVGSSEAVEAVRWELRWSLSRP